MKKLFRLIIAGLLSILSGILWLLSLPKVRDWVWKKTINRGREKVIDAKAKVVEGGEKTTGEKEKGVLDE